MYNGEENKMAVPLNNSYRDGYFSLFAVCNYYKSEIEIIEYKYCNTLQSHHFTLVDTNSRIKLCI